jgi:hypothetical protein
MVCPALIILEICIQIIREKKDSQHYEHNKKLYQYKNPKRFANRHATETIVVK